VGSQYKVSCCFHKVLNLFQAFYFFHSSSEQCLNISQNPNIMGRNYRNRSEELKRLIQVLRSQGIYGIEELTVQLADVIRGYAIQIGIDPPSKFELEYIWQRLIG